MANFMKKAKQIRNNINLEPKGLNNKADHGQQQ